MSTPTFVVGTGRCGSTMMSNMLHAHPKLLSISEFFSVVTDFYSCITDTFSPEPIEGRQFWEIAAAITPFVSFGLRERVCCAEQLYPLESGTTRFTSQTGVPAILVTTLPQLTDDFDNFHDVLGAEVSGWPPAPIGEHYQHLFDCLAEHFGKPLWFERSGGSLGISAQLLNTFPEGRFIHVVRDGRDSAISMREHELQRLGMIMYSLEDALGVNPMTSSDRTRLDRVPIELSPFLPEHFDIATLQAFRFPLGLYGDYWTQQIVSGWQILKSLSADRLLMVRYEDFFTDAKRQLDTLASFLGEEFVDEDWSALCAATVRQPKSTWRDLPEEEAHALTEACRPGFEALREAGVEYEIE